MKDFKVIYLVQGRSDRILGFDRNLPKSSDVIILTWDKPLESSSFEWAHSLLYLPNSSWAEGRNILLKNALKEFKQFDYLIFCDEDAQFETGALSRFEEFLFRVRPNIGFPLSDRIRNEHAYSACEYERAVRHDQVVQAFSFKSVQDAKVLPYDLHFDAVSWHLTCELSQYLIQRYYFEDAITCNLVQVKNTYHRELEVQLNEPDPLSNYIGGVTDQQIKDLRLYITRKYGKQPHVLDTIFQPRIFSKYRLVNLNRTHFNRLIKYFSTNKKEAVAYSSRIVFTLLLNIVYSIFLPRLILKTSIREKNND